MKAYMVFSGYPTDGCLLVFSEKINKARYIGSRSSFEWPYTEVNARRLKHYDKYYEGYSVVDCNEDLHKDAPLFYSEVEC